MELVTAASITPVFIAMYSSFDGIVLVAAPAAWNISSISFDPPRIFKPFASAGRNIGAPRAAIAPDCQSHVISLIPLASSNSVIALPMALRRQARPVS